MLLNLADNKLRMENASKSYLIQIKKHSLVIAAKLDPKNQAQTISTQEGRK